MTAEVSNNQAPGCPEHEDILACLRSELSSSEEAMVNDHLETCPICQAEAAEYSLILEQLESAGEEPLLRDLAPGVLEKISVDEWSEEEPPSSEALPLLPRILFRLAACVAISLIAVYALQKSRPKADPAVAASVQDEALENGMRWLVRSQHKSGKWDPVQWGGRKEYTIGLSGMALLSLVRNENDFEGKVDCRKKAVEFLLAQQDESGRFGDDFDGTMYNHGIASVALLEAFIADKDAALEKPIRDALAFIRDRQLKSGGWGYRDRDGEEANTSVSVWPLQAMLLSAKVGMDSDDTSMKKGLRWLTGVIDEKGNFGYEQVRPVSKATESLTAMGAYCVLKASNEGVNIDRAVLARINHALRSSLADRASQSDFYRTYFRVCAIRESQADQWAESLASIQQRVAAGSESKGPEAGSWMPDDQWGNVGGRIYSTSLAALSLESR